METGVIRFPEAWLEPSDVERVRRLLAQSACQWQMARDFTGAHIHELLREWQHIASTDWPADHDSLQYEYDLECRALLQLILETSCPDTRARLSAVLEPIDAQFRSRMSPLTSARPVGQLPITEGPHFWETHTTHPLELR